MALTKSDFSDRDVYFKDEFEDVMFRYEAASGKFYRKFIGEGEEVEVPHDNELLNQAMTSGDVIGVDEWT